ncbi:hypothetical protein MSG28_007200 [Choristoneura fumiferana]|uniref:Uncharacterized protein n=1 Tax=Choristoneura fumiferana TaxID=7141 RepID=A0ACC0JNI9_CHOFU|nr:hypothetical protein MSG28_007200 [Choristoneura fumiferana]
MYIKSIVLDGFKSYGNRVEITGFDPEFNAITGLNGTGKSNILDSICFVLGITNLSNVRAGSLQELIYKHGQAGITKATVVMGGKNKYLINGINVQNKRVSDLFCSVQLNVNNPHFLIMQGRITKVLNMKPPEILSMVEEAAGTRMYEAKKQAAEKTIEKKDAKLRELNDIIREDIAPKLQKLQDERAQFQEYQKVVRELENVSRLYVAYKRESQEGSREGDRRAGRHSEQADEIKSNEDTSKALEKDIEELNRRLDEQSGSTLKQLETEGLSLEKTEAAASAAHKAAKEAGTSHDKRARLLERALADDEQALAAKKKILSEVIYIVSHPRFRTLSSTFESLRSASETSEAALADAQAKFISVSTGNEGASESLQDQLMAAKQEASEASTSISQAQMEKRHAEDRLKTLEREFKASSAQFTKDQENIGKHQAQLDKLQAELSSMNFSEARNTELKGLTRRLQADSTAKRDALDRLGSTLQRCQFRYQPPTRDFDASKVHGIVARLINVNDPVYCTALETAAAGKLYNVVVDTDATVDLLLKKGNIQTRTTMIPLNKITGHLIDQRTLRLAQQIGGGPENVQRAIDLITFPEVIAPAMAFVFGSIFICRSVSYRVAHLDRDADTANKVTFHPQIRRKCVTIEGDVYDPAGTLSGGARVKGGSVLVQIQQLSQLEQELSQTDAQLAHHHAELAAMQAAADAFSTKHQRYEMMSHELEVIKARLATTSHAQTHAEIEALRARVAALAHQLEAGRAAQAAAAARANELEAKVKDIKGHREREFKKAEEALKKAKKQAEQHSSSWKQREQEFSTLQLEVAELENGVATSARQLAETKTAAEKLAAALQAAKEEHASAEVSGSWELGAGTQWQWPVATLQLEVVTELALA